MYRNELAQLDKAIDKFLNAGGDVKSLANALPEGSENDKRVRAIFKRLGFDDDLPHDVLCQKLYESFLARARFNVNLEKKVRANMRRIAKREHTIAAIAQTLLLHKYNLVIFEDPDYEIRDLHSGEVYWAFEHSNVPLEKFDVDSFLEICGWIEN